MKRKKWLKDVVHQIQRETLGTAPCQIQLVGIEITNHDESAVDILNAQVKLQDGFDRLQVFVDKFMRGQQISDLVEQRLERDNVKLHTTIMNSEFNARVLAAHDAAIPEA